MDSQIRNRATPASFLSSPCPPFFFSFFFFLASSVHLLGQLSLMCPVKLTKGLMKTISCFETEGLTCSDYRLLFRALEETLCWAVQTCERYRPRTALNFASLHVNRSRCVDNIQQADLPSDWALAVCLGAFLQRRAGAGGVGLGRDGGPGGEEQIGWCRVQFWGPIWLSSYARDNCGEENVLRWHYLNLFDTVSSLSLCLSVSVCLYLQYYSNNFYVCL